MGVYGLMTGFSASGALNLVRTALAMCRPDTMSSSGSLNRKRLVLWFTFSTSSSCRLTKPCSPPVRAFLTPTPGTCLFFFSVAAVVLLGVVVHVLDLVQLQADEALLAARQGLLDAHARL